jgi:hypothetical protein
LRTREALRSTANFGAAICVRLEGVEGVLTGVLAAAGVGKAVRCRLFVYNRHWSTERGREE